MADDIGATISNISSGAFSVGITLIIIVFSLAFIFGLIMLIRWYMRYKQYKIVILSQDSFGQVHEEYDEGGIFVDKSTKNKRLYLRKNNVGLEPDNIPYVTTRKGGRVVYIYRTGLKNFRFIKPRIDPDGRLSLNHVGEEDVNWAINSYEKAKKNFATSLIMQYLPFILLSLVSIIILIMFLYLFQQLSVFKDVAQATLEAARALKGTTVLPA